MDRNATPLTLTAEQWANLLEAHIEPKHHPLPMNGKQLTIQFDNADWVIQQAMDAATAQAIGKVADAVVIGSRIIQLIEDQEHAKVVPMTMDFLRGVRKALDA